MNILSGKGYLFWLQGEAFELLPSRLYKPLIWFGHFLSYPRLKRSATRFHGPKADRLATQANIIEAASVSSLNNPATPELWPR
jgi:hypothetical protein